MAENDEYKTIEAQLDNYLSTLKDAVASLNIRIEELQESLFQVRKRMTQIKNDDAELIEMGTVHILG